MAITRIQSASGTALPGSSIAVTLPGAPANGNFLVAVVFDAVSISAPTLVTSVTQVGATWVPALSGVAWDTIFNHHIEIWYAQNVSGAAAGLTVNLLSSTTAAALVTEYSGIRGVGAIVDLVAHHITGVTGPPGVHSTLLTNDPPLSVTTRRDALWLGGVSTSGLLASLTNPQPTTPVGTSIVQQVQAVGITAITGAMLEQIVQATGNPQQSADLSFGSVNISVGGLVAFVGEDLLLEGEDGVEIAGPSALSLEIAMKGQGAIQFTGLGFGKNEGPTPPSVGLLQAISAAIGEADTDIGGLYQTRLTEALGQATALAATYTWNGTTTVTSADTSEVVVGDDIRLDADGRFFSIVSITPNVSVEIDPNGFTIPIGSTQSSKANKTLPVETTFDWPDSGKVSVEGIVYRYTSKTDLSLQGITHLFAGETRPGLLKAHRNEAAVVDISRERTALDRVRRAMLTEFAEGEDLNAIGRNLGVLRKPFLEGDDQFRGIIQALAYNPKGTIFGLELAMNALVGEGNYEISENLIEFPNTVFIRLLGAAAEGEVSEGKAFIGNAEFHDSANDTDIDIETEPEGAVGSVRWKNEDLLTDTRTAFPTAQSIVEYEGDAGTQVWTLVSGTEGVDVTIITADGGAIEWATAAGAVYEHLMRIQPESRASFELLVTIDSSGTLDAAPKIGLRLGDTERLLGVGIADDTGSTFAVGFADFSGGGSFLSGVGAVLNRGTYYSISVQKIARERVALVVDGTVVQTLDYVSFPAAAAADHKVDFGTLATAPASASRMRIRHTAFFAQTRTDYWNARGGNASVGGTLGDRQIDLNTVILLLGTDEGKALEVRGSTAANPEGGNNNGRFLVESVDASDIATLIGATHGGARLSAPVRIEVPENGPLFQFPDDLGKEIEILDSVLGNNGIFVIDKLLEPGTLTDLSSGFSPPPATTNICEVSGPTFTAESGLSWRLRPVFVTEGSLDWELSDAGSISGTILTLRQSLPITTGGYTRVLRVTFSEVLSAQVLLDNSIINALLSADPLLFQYYPLYIHDPLGFIRAYLDDLTAAGVIPDYAIEG